MTDPIEGQFFSPRNQELLAKSLRDDFGRRGVAMNPQQTQRLNKTLQHYMEEVYEVNGSQPVQFLNREAIAATVSDFGSYLNRATVQSVNLAQTQQPALPGGQDTGGQRFLQQDTSSAFERLQSERTAATQRPMPKNIPKFGILSDSDDNTPAATLFEQMQQQREAEAAALSSQTANSAAAGSRAINRFITAGDGYSSANADRNAIVEQALVERNVNRLVAGLPAFPLPQELMPLNEPPNNPLTIIPTMPQQERIVPTANPTVALPNAVRTREALPQDVLIKQPNILTYKEIEWNLVINSGNRDWINNTTESRYFFTVNFNPANNRQGFALSPAAQIRFKNITRIEFVKSIIPAEGLDVLIRRKANYITDSNNSDVVLNALSFPYISVRVRELDNNTYGTNDTLNNTFAVLQYDANWISESAELRSDLTLSRGFLGMIPKFTKSMKTYAPTPLASLQKMTIEFQRPNGHILSDYQDAVNVQGIIPSACVGSAMIFGCNVNSSQAVYTTVPGNPSEYYWVQTTKWFPRHLFNIGDHIGLGNLNITSLINNSNYYGSNIVSGTAVADFANYFTQNCNLLISGIGYYTSNSGVSFYSSGWLSNGVSICGDQSGYANCIILRTRYADPTTGATNVSPFGGSTCNAVALDLAFVGGSNGSLYTLSNARMINYTHQTMTTFRVITRDMDSTTMIRPDNM